jgi:hypothetical protein
MTESLLIVLGVSTIITLFLQIPINSVAHFKTRKVLSSVKIVNIAKQFVKYRPQ